MLAFAVVLGADSWGRARHEPARVKVIIQGMQFDPPTVIVRTGDTVIFDNEDLVAHTATAAGVFDSGEIRPRHTWQVMLRKPGEVSYRCSLHTTMTGKILVE
jgi:plastocyanin